MPEATSPASLNDFQSGIITAQCNKGHISTIIPTLFTYEITINYAFLAFSKGFYRESIIDSYAALEDLYTQIIKSFGMGLVGDVDFNEYVIRLTKVVKLSERRFGAFSFICAINDTEPLVLKQKYIELRNDCVHNGINPGREKAFEYIKEVTKLLVEIQNHARFSKNLLLYKDAEIGKLALSNLSKTPTLPVRFLSSIVDPHFLKHVDSAFGSLDSYLSIDNEHLWENMDLMWQHNMFD